ncbi:MAG: LD-carboxypeptidase [Rhodothermales bacterium]|nr:LD-carboxypeptidase [Rhodothermales bacterium]
MPLPPPLTPGDTVAIIAPASLPTDPEALPRGVARLEALGCRVEVGRSTIDAHGYLAGPDADRLDEINRYLRRDDVRALVCVRGGYGTLRLLPDLDYAAARRHPKLLVGYSDVTALHLALHRNAGWRGLAGPMAAVEWGVMDAAAEAQFWQVAGGAVLDPLTGPRGEPLHPLRPGAAEGVLLGGNLTLVARLVGTPYLPDLSGAILFLEEVGELPYRIDGLLAQLRLAGILERLGGVVLGHFTEWEPDDDRPTLSLDAVLDDYFGAAPYPVATGLAYGHVPYTSTIPVGVRARLEVAGGTATLAMCDPVAG